MILDDLCVNLSVKSFWWQMWVLDYVVWVMRWDQTASTSEAAFLCSTALSITVYGGPGRGSLCLYVHISIILAVELRPFGLEGLRTFGKKGEGRGLGVWAKCRQQQGQACGMETQENTQRSAGLLCHSASSSSSSSSSFSTAPNNTSWLPDLSLPGSLKTNNKTLIWPRPFPQSQAVLSANCQSHRGILPFQSSATLIGRGLEWALFISCWGHFMQRVDRVTHPLLAIKSITDDTLDC